MRKNILALILLLPLLFVFVVFSSVKTASLGVPVSANGIEILERPEDDVFRIDLATYDGDYTLKARVTPESASNRGYVYKAEGDAVTVDGDGVIRPLRAGEARLSVVSKDGGFEDSVRALVYASKPYDFEMSLFELSDFSREKDLLMRAENGYEGELLTGNYLFSLKTLPEDVFIKPSVTVSEGIAFIDRAAGTVLFPFSGKTELSLALDGQLGGKTVTIEKKVSLDLQKLKTESGLVINGGNPALVVDRGGEEAVFYVEGEVQPAIIENSLIKESIIEELGEGKYKVTVRFTEEKRDFSLFLEGINGEKEEVTFTFADFDFSVRSDLPVQSDTASVIVGSPVSFYALPSVAAGGITYSWSAPEGVETEQSADGAECKVTARAQGDFELAVRAYRNGVPLDLFEKKIPITAVRRVTSAQFALKTDLGLARMRSVARERVEGGEFVQNTYELPLICFDGGEKTATADMEIFSSDESIAKVTVEDGFVRLLPLSNGVVTVTAKWRGNDSFGTSVAAETTLHVVDGVEVETSPELYHATSAGKKIVLKNDILLGTDDGGAPLPVSEREKLLGRAASNYNTEYYKNRGESAETLYALEIKNDIYGNGYSLNAELFTAATDGAVPLFFRGPLDFVRFGQVASVAAQDNSAFLVRTDGVKLYNLTLLGCGDEALAQENGYDLSALNTVGTTLEVNASAEILNCRIRNGRTVMRVYGGNRAGESYFTENLSELNDRAKKERITVRIEGCILSQGREFLLKIGANGAIRANSENGIEPDLTDEQGNPYAPQTNGFDDYFYDNYVLTDVTLKDSVLETSGLFTIGVESNFSGELLSEEGEGSFQFEGWQGTGGTSLASVLRLKGDVRLYDWKELSLIDSSTLIETELPELKLDIAAMLGFVCEKYPEDYGDILDEGFVHGGIAFYGGGKNFSGLDSGELFEDRADFGEYHVNISVLGEADGSAGYLGQILPSAAGSQDFRFYLYTREGRNNKAKEQEETESGTKYEAVKSLSPV